MLCALVAVYWESAFLLQAYQVRWFSCIDYLADGTLYGNRSECVQTPMVYIWGLWVKGVFGAQYLQTLTYMLIVALNAGSAYIILKLIDAKREVLNYAIIAAYNFLILPAFINWENDRFGLGSIFAGFFLLCGAYYLLKREGVSLASIFFALAMVSKINVDPA